MPGHLGGSTLSTISLLALLVAGPAAAQEDAPGAEDHPLLSRFQGSTIDQYRQRDFDEYVLAVGPWSDGQLADVRPMEGKVTRVLYRLPEGTSILEAYRSYQRALAEAGFETLFTCAGAECGSGFVEAAYLNDVNDVMDDFSPGQAFYFRSSFDDENVGEKRYLAARLHRPEGDVFVSLAALSPTTMTDLGYWKGRNYAALDLVEVQPMEEGRVTAGQMREEIDRAGHVTVEGILFDFNEAVLKPESRPALEEIAALLTEDPDLRVYIVGHTDNAGTYEHNLDLSRRRAAAVVDALVAEHGIERGRLMAVGVGPVAPVASNETEAGREQNRRAVLVKM